MLNNYSPKENRKGNLEGPITVDESCPFDGYWMYTERWGGNSGEIKREIMQTFCPMKPSSYPAPSHLHPKLAYQIVATVIRIKLFLQVSETLGRWKLVVKNSDQKSDVKQGSLRSQDDVATLLLLNYYYYAETLANVLENLAPLSAANAFHEKR